MKITRSKIITLFLLAAVSVSLFAAGEIESTETGKTKVAVSIAPQAFAVSRVAGDLVEVITLVGPGQSPHNYETTPRQMADLAESEAWFLSGTDFENALVPKVTALYPDLPVIDTTEGVTFRMMDEHSHEDEHEDEHSHEDEHDMVYDKHTWLSKDPYIIQVNHIADTLSAIDAENASVYKENAAEFITEIEQLFAQLRKDLAPLSGSTVFVYHPAFGYFLDEFNISQEAVETGGKEPTAKTLAALIEEAQEEEVKAIFVQEQFPKEAAKSVADAVGAQVLSLDSLAYDWLENIRKMGDTLIEASRL
ncbi:MAG: zinc ABC transporter substrate-binding protein [Sphaerochaetaceae bacterium]|nr:zinc ABC transporter substrate-binding protein [Sphaerochaetaceae bacterium]MDC7247125.1 zinc ABC transporter substrate-binding protein [Sphaerochaetaceae bacterium]